MKGYVKFCGPAELTLPCNCNSDALAHRSLYKEFTRTTVEKGYFISFKNPKHLRKMVEGRTLLANVEMVFPKRIRSARTLHITSYKRLQIVLQLD